MHRSLFLATYFADLDSLERVHEPGQMITVLLELSERKAQKLLRAGMTAAGRSPHMLAPICHKRQLQDEPSQAGGVHCAASIGKLGQSSHTFPRWSRAPEWRGVGRMEQSHASAILGACGALDTTEMKTPDDQATAGSNTEDFLELRRVTEVRAKRAPLLTLANWRGVCLRC